MSESQSLQNIKYENNRRGEILEVSFKLFTSYGFSKITMDDIAKEIGVSRPALYQTFKNKYEIYRGLVEEMCAHSLKQVEDIHQQDIGTKDQIIKAIEIAILRPVADLEKTPHGAELLSLKNDISGDIFESFGEVLYKHLHSVYSIIANEQFDADLLSTQLLQWIEGMKTSVSDPKMRSQMLERFVEMQCRAISR